MSLIYQRLKPYEHRERLENFIARREMDEIGNIPGIRIIERRRDNPEIYDCLKLVSDYLEEPRLLESQEIWVLPQLVFERLGYRSVEEPEDRDVILYCFDLSQWFDEENTPFKHLGIMIGTEVRSKWGPYNIFQHPLNAIPNQYGNSVAFFRKE